jgi:hypothetical protein
LRSNWVKSNFRQQLPTGCQRVHSLPKPGGPAGGLRVAAASASQGAVLVAVNAVGELGSWKVKRWQGSKEGQALLLQAAAT